MPRRVSVLRNYCWNWQKSKLWCDGWWQMWLQIKTKWIFLCHWAHPLQLSSKRMFLWSGSFTTTRWAKLMGSFESLTFENKILWNYQFCDTKKSLVKTAQFMTRDPRPPHQITDRVLHLVFFGQILYSLGFVDPKEWLLSKFTWFEASNIDPIDSIWRYCSCHSLALHWCHHLVHWLRSVLETKS